MALDLTHYEKVYSTKKRMAIDVAEILIDKMNARPADMLKAHTSNFVISSLTEPRIWLDDMCKIMGCLMFSSGYWVSHKSRTTKTNKVTLTFDISIMTDDEKVQLLMASDDDDDGYSSDDDEPTPKVETGDTPQGESNNAS